MLLYVVRHGETEWSKNGRHTGSTDLPLTEHGREVARRLQPIFADKNLSRVLVSPLQRARVTCELAGLSGEIDPDLREWNYGEYEGLTTGEIFARRPGWLIFRDGCPGGESPDEVAARADRVLARVAGEGDAALFAHGHILRMLVARFLGLPPLAAQHFLLDTATLNVLGRYRDAPAVKIWNAPIDGG